MKVRDRISALTIYVALPGTPGCSARAETVVGNPGSGAIRYHAVHVGDAPNAPSSTTAATTVLGELFQSLGIPRRQEHRYRLVSNRCQKRWGASSSLSDVLNEAPRESFFSVIPVVHGGGADGGSTGNEDRKAFLEMYAGEKPDAVDPKELRLAKYTICQLSQEPLSKPIVCDDLGQLYNKEAFLNALLAKTIPKALGHLSRKTVFDVELSELDGGASDGIKYGCPITALPLNGKVRFVVVRDAGVKGSKGWIVSKKAVDELKEVVGEVTGGFTEVLPLYPEGEELEAAMKRVAEKTAMMTKKGKKKRAAENEEASAGEKREKKNVVPVPVSRIQGEEKGEDKGEAYRSIFLDTSKKVATTNTSNDFMVRGKGR